MVLIGLYHPKTLELVRSEGPFPKDQLPWDDIRIWQSYAEIILRVLHDA